MIRSREFLLALLPAASLLFAPAAEAQDAQIVFERTGYRLTSLGARVAVSARVLDGRRRAVPNAPIAWRIQDPAVATVNARGEVQSRRVGRTRVWAVSGGDSASALILVDQWAARFAFSPPVLRFDAVNEQKPLQVQARDASGNAIAAMRSAAPCRSLNDRVASLGANGQVRARGSGVTYVRCTDRGVADSVRVEVRQRPSRAQIADKGAFSQRTVGDSFPLRMRAYDAIGEEIRDARPTWASLEPRIVSVDPLSGMARAVGVGAVKIVAQVGDLTDTVSVAVAAGAGMNMAPIVSAPVEAAGAPEVETGRAALAIYAPFPAVGDTATINITARNPDGAQADAATVQLRSSDTTVVKLVRGQRVVGLKEGTAYVVGTFGGIRDSALVSVRARGASLLGARAAGNFVRPTFDTATARRRSRAQVDSVQKAILASSPIRTGYRRMVAGQFLAAQVSHATHLSESVVESRTGLLFGGRLTIAPLSKLQLTGDFRTGTLTPDKDVLGEDLNVTDVEGQLSFLPAPWIALRGGFTKRVESTETAVLHWQFASASVIVRPKFVGERVTAIIGGAIIPYGLLKQTKTTTIKPEPTSMSGEAGLEFQTGFFNAAMTYYVEKFTFPVEANQRVDRFSMLRVRVGLQVGR